MNQKLSVKPVSKRLLAPLIVGLMLLIVGVIFLVSYLHRQHSQEVSRLTEQEILSDLQFLYEENYRFLKTLADTLVQSPALRSALKDRDAARLLTDFQGLAGTFQQEHGLSHFYFHSVDRDVLLRVYKPETIGGRADRFVVRKAEETGRAAAGLELGSMGTLALRVVQPVFEEETLVGFLELGVEYSLLLERLPVSRQTHLAMILQKSFLHRERWEEGMRWLNRRANWNQFPDDVLVYSTLADLPQNLASHVGEENHAHGHSYAGLRLEDKDWRVMMTPLVDAAGNLVGDLMVMYDITSLNTTYRRVMGTIIGGGGTLLLLLCGLVFVLLQRADQGIRQQQQALAESEAKYRVLFDNSSVSIVIHDNQAEIIDANQCALRSYGVSTVEYLKRLDIYSEHSRQELDELLAKLETEGSQRFTWCSRNVKGELFWEDVTLSKMMVAGEVRIVASAIDITERKTTEAALQKKNEEIEQFVYVVSHDLKSPLITVKSFLNMLQQDIADNDIGLIEKDVAFINGAVDKMEQLMGALLNLSRVGKFENSPETTTFIELINGSLVALVGPMQQHQVDFDVQTKDVKLRGDLLKLGQIWQNLIENAIKYRNLDLPPKIEVGVETQAEDVVFYVRDNGVGIAPQDAERVFVLFAQLNSNSDGSGLGLALVKKIVEQYHGRIWVESAGEGQGSCFRFTLPGAVVS